MVMVSQTGVVPAPPKHCALVVHDRTQVFVAVSQTIVPASPQLPLVRHCTQLPALEQYGRAVVPQFVFERQATHFPPLQ